ncbi:1-phosphatidylinositol-3-phosphate 5-kinase [Trichoderma citrinoviride]|uniref:Mitochondrial distribution and morphology protein 12 n=1 Tax=Trichoderma citrinoviride TaxID=58853 RepID=A0A2T4B9I9_9HYPO|nr:1-phosphatidylinositol-3-phosphate 5-kinase [Trichoderma citrinoviride]PTB65997.1 1-phosphatidylinositol-3-phosphate 5-kinase [Trichoderma citrinoviride]
MASHLTTSKPLDGSSFSGSLISPTRSRDRRDSINSVSVSSGLEKEQLAQALDQIHTTASRTDSLTLFNEFNPPPVVPQDTESRGTVQQGLSGLYSRLRVAVGGGSSSKAAQREDDADKLENLARKSSASGEGHRSKPSTSSLSRTETAATASTASSQHVQPDAVSPTTPGPADGRPQMPSTAKSGSISLIGGSKSHPSGRQSLPTNATSDVTADPTITSARKREPSRSSVHTEDSGTQGSRRRSTSRADFQTRLPPVDSPDGSIPSRSPEDESISSMDGGGVEAPLSPVKGKTPLSPLQTLHSRSPSAASSLLSPVDDVRRKPAIIDRISHANRLRYPASRDSSVDRGTAEASPISTSAHNIVHHNSFSQESNPQHLRTGDVRIPGTTASHQGATDQMNAQLDRMRRQILSKEFWMKDETVKECFLCQAQFTAFRRKHHCRTCGFIFDSKCTVVIPGDRFGLPGTLRVCKRCLDVITRRFDASASEDSGDEQSYLPRIFGAEDPRRATLSFAQHSREQEIFEGSGSSRPVTTPMMTIPATRRLKESNNTSSVLEIGAPQLSRPSSSRSLRSLSSVRPQSSAGHKRHHSKHGLLGRIKPDQAPFRRGIQEEYAKRTKFPAFHDDNIIDPELADFMSDDSSGDDEQQIGSIFETLNSPTEVSPTSYEPDKSNLSALVNTSRKPHHRHRGGEKSISGMSHFSRSGFGLDELAPGFSSHRRTTRRRNLSVSGSVHHFGSPRPKSVYKGPSASSEMLFPGDSSLHPNHSGTQLVRSHSLQKLKAAKTKLNESSLKHVDKLLYQLLTDDNIPNPAAWQKALVPILLQATDDVSPDVANGESMDIRTYVKLKRIPGGKPGDTSYISGIVFTKNLALKSMPRKIANPRILLVGFPIEYQRHQQQFMSLEPVIAQEKEFLRIVVQRIAALKPQVLLAEKAISGLALQYLSEANISVAFNVKRSVIAAVARCTETKIIESLDMLEAQVGRCSAFEVRTFVNNDYPGRKKSYIFLSGCRPELGCTITLRGASDALLAKMKYITDFMVYVVYNLKLESSLLRDESVEPPDANEAASMSNSFQALNDSIRSLSSAGHTTGGGGGGRNGPIVVVNQPSSESEAPTQTTMESSSFGGTDEAQSQPPVEQVPSEPPKLLSLHDAHAHDSTFSQVPDDVPMPTFYSDMVAKYETKILSASPYVRFPQPYLLMKAREQERRLLYLKRLRDQDMIEENLEKNEPPEFQLIKPEMVEELGRRAPRQIMEILHAVHDAEYDKALYNYQTQTRQWETYIQGNLDLFDPYSHQNIIILYSVICTETKIPCTEPSLVGINFYDEQREDTSMDPDCTLGQYIEYLINSKDEICDSNGCDRKMSQHHRTFVHDQFRITVFVEHLPNAPPRSPELGDGIVMWTYCKICQKDSEEIAMSETTYKYSFGKYLELLYWGRGLRMKDAMECPHDHQKDHVRYFSLHDSRVRIHWDPIDLLEIIVPRARLTWKVSNDLKLKNDIYAKMDERWAKFMATVIARLESIRIDSVLPEKAESCKSELERLMQKAKEDQVLMVQRLQEIYVNSKYYEVVPFNIIVREMLETASEWDQIFATFEADFLGDKDMRQLTMLQLKKMFTDNESKESLVSTEGTGSAGDSEERPSQTFSETEEKPTQSTDPADGSMEASVASAKPAEEKPDMDGNGPAPSTEDKTEPIKPLESAKTAPAAIPDSQATTDGDGVKPVVITTPAEAAPTAQTPASPGRMARSPTNSSISGQSLSEKVEASRRDKSMQPRPSQESSERPADVETHRQVSEQGARRKSATTSTSPPITRTISQPSRTLSRLQSLGKSTGPSDVVPKSPEPEQQSEGGSIKSEKKLSERLGLNVLKNRGKMAGSSIPRLVAKKRESKVTTLAKHFEQLSREFSREFEKERIRDRKKRAASMRNPRPMLPKTSTQAIVQVYDNVNEAFDEPALTSEPNTEQDIELQDAASSLPGGKSEGSAKLEVQTAPPTPGEPAVPLDGQPRWDEDTTNVNTSQGISDDEGGGSDAEPSVTDEYMPDIKEMADSNAEVPLELPKHQKMSLMKYLANFWAERSASGWPALEYPVNATDHIFVDSDIIVREDEPSSVIALALNSDDYKEKLANIRRDAHQTMLREADGVPDGKVDGKVDGNVDGSHDGDAERDIDGDMDAGPKSAPASDSAEWATDESELEKSLLRATGTHLKYQFKEGAAVMTCKIFYAEQFDALRRKCGVAERIVESLSRCLQWDSKGGKTKSVFLKTLDDRLVLKSLSTVETSAFLRFAPGYFSIMAEALFHDLPSVIAKMMGFFQVVIKNPVTGTDIKLDLLVTENLFYDRSPTRIFDLKGSMRNRKIQSTGEQNEVLLDENMVEYIYESPLFAREHSKKLLRASVWNDTLFLARQNVMDYSLMIAVDEKRKELVVGIIDCIRTYTWDKKLESWIKDRGFAGGGRNRPTVTSPKEYKSRFREAMARAVDAYFSYRGRSRGNINEAAPRYPKCCNPGQLASCSVAKQQFTLMSIDLNWETLTTGPDGEALAESIRTFIHSKFQTVQLPRFIRSVNVHGFDFGTIPPELELKDITDPLPDFYEQDDDDDDDEGDKDEDDEAGGSGGDEKSLAEREREKDREKERLTAAMMEARRRENGLRELSMNMGGLGREASLSSIDNLQAVLGAGQDAASGQQLGQQRHSMAKSDVSSTLGPPSRPSTSHGPASSSAVDDDEDGDDDDDNGADNERRREPRVEDVQAVFRIRYSGDVRLNLTAEILLDYPMPSFVGIPLKLNITGLTFDGVGVLAHIRKRVHFCFLNPDDALAAVGPEAAKEEEASTTTAGGGDLQASSSAGKKQPAGRFGGLLQEIKVESEIGERESGRQSLKNVGKVERFVLEQVRRIFEEEFVYPSFWTFLV